MIGRTVGRYRVLERLGEGGMGVVYLAEDLTLRRPVALKFLTADMTTDPEARARLVHEARAAAALVHPNICPVHEIAEADGRAFIAMAHLEGQTLRERLGRGPVPLDEALAIARQVGEALAAAHAKGIVHRDLKPANVMLMADGRAVLMDFGLAKIAGASRLTRTGTTLGTMAYMSPEAMRGETIDARADVWALGVLLYELLEGRLPFAGGTDAAVMHAVMNAEPKPLRPAAKQLPAGMAGIVSRALAKESTNRYPGVAELVADLRTIEADERALPAGRGRRTRSQRAAVAQRIAIAGMVMLAVTLAALNADRVRRLMFGGESVISAVAVLPFDNASGDASQEFLVSGLAEELMGQLAQIAGLRVISRTSVMSLKGSRLSIPAIARRLGVDAVVEGTVACEGDLLRVTATLVRASPERQIWSQSYSRRLAELLTLQSEVAQAIAREIRVKLTPEERARIARVRSVDPAVHEAYLRGRFYLNKLDERSFRTAIDLFNGAIRGDPNYAPAWAGLALTYYYMSNVYLAPAQAMPLARAAARRAVEADDQLAEGHAVLGVVLAQYDRDWEGAEREFRRSIELNPGVAESRLFLSALLSATGRDSAAAVEYGRAASLDPLSDYIQSVWIQPDYLGGRYDQAITRCRGLLEREPHYFPAHGAS